MLQSVRIEVRDKMAAMTGKNGTQSPGARMMLRLQNQAQFVARREEERHRFDGSESDLAQIKTFLLEHHRILKNHEQILRDMPEVMRQKIGFTSREDNAPPPAGMLNAWPGGRPRR